ncbi:MAG: sugar ABC transporter permease [Bacilli bacterium]
MEKDNNIDYTSLENSENVFTKEVKPLPWYKSLGQGTRSFLVKIILWVIGFLWDIILGFWSIFKSIYKIAVKGSVCAYKFVLTKIHQFKFNDWSGRLSFIFFGSSSFKNKQYVNGALFLLTEIGFIIYMILFGGNALFLLGSLGQPNTDIEICYEDPIVGKICEPRMPDNSILVLIFGLLTVIMLFGMAYLWNRSVSSGYKNYRIKMFDNYRVAYEDSITYSTEVDEKTKELKFYTKDAPKDREIILENFYLDNKHIYEEKISSSLISLGNDEKFSKKFGVDYFKYLHDLSVTDAKANIKINVKLFKKITSLKTKMEKELDLHLEKRALMDKTFEELKQNVINKEEASDVNNKKGTKEITKFETKIYGFERRYLKKHDFYSTKLKELEKELEDENKAYSPSAVRLLKNNYSAYSKFNIYYKHLREIDDDLLFYNNFDAIKQSYMQGSSSFNSENEENINKKAFLKNDLDAKIATTNKTYDLILEKKRALKEQLSLTMTAKKTMLQALKMVNYDETNAAASVSQVLATSEVEISGYELNFKSISKMVITSFDERIKKIDGRINALPTDKDIKDMREEEIKNYKHAFKRDFNCIKIDHNGETFGKESTINFMMLNYDIQYKKACLNVVLLEEILDKKNTEESFVESEYVANKINELNSEKEEFSKSSSTHYVGRSTKFKEQIKGLFNENFHLTLLALPIIGVLIVTIIPLAFSIVVAFTNYSQGHIPPTQLFTWVGLENFGSLFFPTTSDLKNLPQAMLMTLGWTIIWAIVATFSNYILGIIVALMINKDGIKFKKLWRGIFVMSIAIPQFISLLSIGVLLQDNGAFSNRISDTFNFNLGFAKDTTNGALVTKIIIIIVNIWVGIPYTILSTTGILMNIPRDLYESARIDGASPTTQFTKITLPYILFVTGPHLITQFIGNINNFNVIYFLTGGGPDVSGSQNLQIGHTDLLITYIYKIVTSANNPMFSIASCIGIVVFVLCSFFSIIMYNRSNAVLKEDQFQ